MEDKDPQGIPSRKRGHPSKNEWGEAEGLVGAEGAEPSSKRRGEASRSQGVRTEASGSDGSSAGDEGGLQIVEEDEAAGDDDLSDLPPEALHATTRAQFIHHMRPYMWLKFPSAMASEVSAFINARWTLLKANRKAAFGMEDRRRRSEVETLGVELDEADEGASRSSRQRAAKRVAKNAYTMDIDDLEFMDSPASSAHSRDTGSVFKKDRKVGRRKKRRKGKQPLVAAAKDSKPEPRVPPMKIKMIGRSGESDSPIFFAESMESWDEASDSEQRGSSKRKKKKKAPRMKEGVVESDDSSIIVLGEQEEGEEEEEELMDESRPPSEGERHEDSEGEHADYCYTCKDGGELLCCDTCPLAYHLKCLVPPMTEIPKDDWRCPRCKAEPLQGKVERIHTWRWKEMPVKAADAPVAGHSEPEDDAVMEEGVEKKEPVEKKELVETYKIRELFVKWQGKSYWKNSWVPEISLEVFQPITLRAYTRKHNMDTPPKVELPPHVQRRHKRRSTASFCDEKMEDQEITLLKAGVRPQWLQIHRVINRRTTRSGTEYLVKWRELPYDCATWEKLGEDCGLRNAPQAIKEYEDLRVLMDPRKKERKEKKRGRRAKVVVEPITKYEQQPELVSKTGGKLHPYQLEGLNWLRFSWNQHTNTILADEMGLGKTIQTITFLNSLYKEGRSNGPFLISAPLSTIVNWSREFEFWAPDLYVVTYTGDKENRAAIREHEFSFVNGAVKKSNTRLYKMKEDAPLKFHVLLTSYEYITVDCTVLQSINWEVLVVDEAHRLKNNQSKFFRFLSGYDIKYKLLLTGTPLQNNLEELFHLLNFLNPIGFDSLEQFQEEFEDISKEDQVKKLHDLLAPHLLRRLKADVLKNIPPKRELIVRVDLTPTQKKIYRWILTRNFEKLNTRGAQPVSLLNIMMDLKKICNHPYLFPSASQEAPLTASGYYQGKELVEASGKFLVLEKMMKRLKEQGHRMLIFSQMTRMLDILEDFMEYLGYKYERIDGSVTGAERQQSIDRFNNPNSDHFVFLLSTRAGGLGINLATADTVIIYDSDWNPHNDIQAFSRAHRIGQSNKVMIYRFVTRSSVEERITEVAKKKMMLTHLVVRPGMGAGGSAPSLSKRELDDILRFGTEDLFKDETSDTAIHYDEKTIEALLDREQELTMESAEIPGSENLLANEYLSSFKVASYVTKEVADEEPETEILKEETVAQPDPDFWEKLLRHHYEQQRELEEAKLGKGKRIRKQVNYLDASEDRGRESDQSSYQQSDEHESESESDGGQDFEMPGVKKRKGPSVPLTDGLPPLLAKVRGNIYVLGFNPRQRKAFLNSVMRYGMPPPNAFHTNWKVKDLRAVPENAFNAYVNLFMRHLCEPNIPNSTTYSDGVPCEPVTRQNILTRIGIMRLVRNKVEQYSELNGEYSVERPEGESEGGPTVQVSVSTNEPTVIQISLPNSALLEDNAASAPHTKSPESVMEGVEEGKSGETSPTSKECSASPASSLGSSSSSGTSNETSPSAEATPKTTPPPKEEPVEKMEMDDVSAPPVAKAESAGRVEVIVSPPMKKEPVGVKPVEELGVEEGGQSSTLAQKAASVETLQAQGTGLDSQAQGAGQPAPQAQGTKQDSTVSKTEGEGSAEAQGAGKAAQPEEEEVKPKFMFNIADGGFTELHTLWGEEKTKGFSLRVWGRHHDYWLLKGLVAHGYCRWSEMCADPHFALLNKPFGDETCMTDTKSRFLLKRFKLLEQALAVEEQLHRASNARLYQDPNHSVMQLHSRYTDLECLADGHTSLVPDCLAGDRNSILLMKKAVTKMEELLIEMKSDVARLPNELSKIQNVSTQLKMDEISIISKLAKTPVSQSVIAQAPPIISSSARTTGRTSTTRSKSPRAIKKEVVVVSDKAKATKVVYAAQPGLSKPGPQVQLPGTPSLTTMKTPEGLVVYSAASNTPTPQAVTVVSAAAGTATTSSAVAIGVPTYLDGSSLYQLVPAASAQQVVYLPSMVGAGQTSAQVTTVPANVLGTGIGSQLAVVQGNIAAAPGTTAAAVLQPVQIVDGKIAKGKQKSVITID